MAWPRPKRGTSFAGAARGRAQGQVARLLPSLLWGSTPHTGSYQSHPMKKSVSWLVSWALYWVGHGLSQLLRLDLAIFYRPYNRAMLLSADVQDWGGGNGPWSKSAIKGECEMGNPRDSLLATREDVLEIRDFAEQERRKTKSVGRYALSAMFIGLIVFGAYLRYQIAHQ